MDVVYTELTDRVLKLLHNNTLRRSLILIAGPPGSGKSTIADNVAARINNLIPPIPRTSTTQPGRHAHLVAPTAVVVRMDGFHLTRAHLSTMHNADEAHARRGAAWTFDADGVVNLFKQLSQSTSTNASNLPVDISVPTFDHATKDPVLNGDVIEADTSIVILEGNWLLYDEDPWRQLSTLVDETWFVDVDPDTARQRIAQRHLQSGIELNLEAALRRADSNDLLNGDDVRRRLIPPDVTVWSVDD